MKKNIYSLLFSLFFLIGYAQVPVPSFSVSNTQCVGNPISFTDQSSNTPTGWSWTFSGGVPATSSSQFPSVIFSTSGNHVVTLVATNGSGSSSTLNATITVNPNPTISVGSQTACNGSSVSFTATGASSYTWLPSNANGSVYNTTANSSTTYTINGASSFGCKSSTTANLIVYSKPVVTVTSGSMCVGTNLVLTAGGASTYSWSTGQFSVSAIVSPTTDAVFSVVGTDVLGCKNTAVASVAVFPLPFITVTSGTTCPNQGIPIFAGGATTYTWGASSDLFPHDTNPNEAIVTPTAQATYTVYGTNNNGCVNSATTTVYTSLPPDFALTSATVCPGITATLVATPISSISTFFWSNGTNGLETAANATATTIYTCTANTDNGCSSAKTTTLYIYPSPVLGSSSGTVCFGKSYTINANGAVSYTWSTGSNSPSIIVTPTVTTSYAFSGESVNGCIGNSVVSVSVIPLPNVFIAPKSVCLGKSIAINAIGASSYIWSTGANTQSISVSPSVTTNYTCTGFAITGCSNTAVTTVTVFSTPTVALTSSSICVGQTATLSAAAANTYTWSTGNHSSSIFVLPTATTSYTCVGLSVNNCEYFSTTVVNVSSVTTPSVSQSGFILTSNSTTGNQWYYNGVLIPGATGQIYTATQYGSYAVSVSNSFGCQSISANVTLLDVGVEEIDFRNNISLSPNPTNNVIHVSINKLVIDDRNNLLVNVYNATGQIVKSHAFNEQINNQIDLEALPSGIYVLECKAKQHQAFFKILKY